MHRPDCPTAAIDVILLSRECVMHRLLKRPLPAGEAGRMATMASKVLRWTRLRLQQPRYDGKVFCIGYNKTGTTSVGAGLAMLGLRHSSFCAHVWRDLYLRGRIKQVLDYTARFESLDDLPWLRQDMIPILDTVFPGSRFVYLERDIASWERSYAEWTLLQTGREPDMHRAKANFLAHRDFVHGYFTGRSGADFVSLDVRDPCGLRKLAAFLGRKVPQDAFPYLNITADIASRMSLAGTVEAG